MKEIVRVNFLHYGDALALLSKVKFPSTGRIAKHELLSSIENGYPPSNFLRSVIANYGGSRLCRVDLASLKSDLARTFLMRKVFGTLGCRGFSYAFFSDMQGFPYRLRRQIDLRVALIASPGLFYPPRVRRYVARHRANHYFLYEAPAIAFALGMTTRRKWYVFIMQSDLYRRGPACVREHFRGWRKVLFANIVQYASETADRIYLCSEDDVLNGCHEGYFRPLTPPETWQSIYRGTAHEFGMDRTEMRRGINIQLYDRRPPVYARSMYCLDLVPKPRTLPN